MTLMVEVGGLGVPQCRPQDSIANDKVEFLQVGSWPVLQHAVAMETVLAIIQALGNLQGIHYDVLACM